MKKILAYNNSQRKRRKSGVLSVMPRKNGLASKRSADGKRKHNDNEKKRNGAWSNKSENGKSKSASGKLMKRLAREKMGCVAENVEIAMLDFKVSS
jgi:hypothetical protein